MEIASGRLLQRSQEIATGLENGDTWKNPARDRECANGTSSREIRIISGKGVISINKRALLARTYLTSARESRISSRDRS